jgi:hypothetical protein
MKSNLNDTAADGLAATSLISWMAHMSTTLQPIISACAGLVAIISGLFAIRYYYLKTKK